LDIHRQFLMITAADAQQQALFDAVRVSLDTIEEWVRPLNHWSVRSRRMRVLSGQAP